jgi:carbon monoxide dehydrogenase subunit G
MKPIEVSTTIAAAPERVFAIFTDLAGAPSRMSGIKRVELLKPGPVRVGTKWRETRVFGKREATEVLEVTEMRPNESFGVGCSSCGCRYDSTFRFERAGSGTKVTATMRGTAMTLSAKLFAPLLGALMRGMMTKCVQQDLGDAKRAAEASA